MKRFTPTGPTVRHRRALLRALPAGILVVSACVGGAGDSLGDHDVEAVRELSARYGAAWLAGDTAAVLGVFAEDAVLVPAMGARQVEGKGAIRDFFWPAGGSPASVVEFDRQSVDVRGRGSLAWDRGTYTLAFVYQSDTTRSSGNYLAISERGAGGEWRWTAYAWTSR